MREGEFLERGFLPKKQQDLITKGLTYRAGEADKVLERLDRPDVVVCALVARQRQSAVGLPGSPIDRPRVRKSLETYWDVIVRDLRTGRPSSTHLEFAFNIIHGDVHGIVPEAGAKALEAVNIFNIAALTDMADSKRPLRTRLKSALAKSVHVSHGVYFNPESPHLRAVVLARILQSNGSLQDLDIEDPDALMAVRLDDLSHYVDLSVGSGESAGFERGLPQDVWNVKQGLTSFWGDVAAARNGNRAVGRQAGRRWKLLFNEGGEKRYQQYLRERVNLRDESNLGLMRSLQLSPENLAQEMHETIADLADEGDTYIQNMRLNERLGVLWAAASLRRANPHFAQILTNYQDVVRENLEPYAQDGLPLIAERQDPYWLRYVMWQSLMDKTGTGPTTIFTDEYSPIVDDRRDAGDALSKSLKIKLGQADFNDFGNQGAKTNSSGYGELNPAVCVVTAYDLIAHAERSALEPAAFSVFEDLEKYIRSLSPSAFRAMLVGLPNSIRLEVKQIRG
ncbi:MAG TPA: hypothetical protein VLA77_00525 [Candidatus Saccharimonadales bacterium]|nr:hypothetical protein [Candidatus Saccharimonadales bacterium]